MEWDFTLSGEVLSFVSWKRGANEKIGIKASSGDITLFLPFQGQFNISLNDPATLIIYNTSAAEGEEITCNVITNVNSWEDAILVVIKGEWSFCCFTLYMHVYVCAQFNYLLKHFAYSTRECASWFMLTVDAQVAMHLSGCEEENKIL